MKLEDKMLNTLVFLLLVMPFIIAALVNIQWVTPSITTDDVVELRKIAHECHSRPHGHTHIVTTYDAPIGQPRKPVSWTITCN